MQKLVNCTEEPIRILCKDGSTINIPPENQPARIRVTKSNEVSYFYNEVFIDFQETEVENLPFEYSEYLFIVDEQIAKHPSTADRPDLVYANPKYNHVEWVRLKAGLGMTIRMAKSNQLKTE